MRATLVGVVRAIHVRLDEESARALAVVRDEAMTDSEAVRIALREAAARRRSRASLLAEVAALAADPGDRAQMALIREQMAAIFPDPGR